MKNILTLKTAFSIVVACLFSAFFAGAFVIVIGQSFPEESQKTFTFISFVIGQGFMLFPLLCFLKIRKEPFSERLRIRLISSDTLVSTIFLSFGVIILSDELDRIIQIFFPAPEYILDLNGLMRPETIVGFLLLFLAVVIIAPLGEELIFRGFLQQILEQHWRDITKAVLVTALLFAMIHMNPYWFIQIYILGILLGFLAWKTKSVFPPLVLHSINNAMALLFSFSEIESYNFYILNEHVAPWFIVFALYATFISFKRINRIKV